MIKSLSLLTRKSGLSREEFRRVWEGEHAPLVKAVPQVRRYVLSFVLDEPTRPDVPTQAMNVDAVAELWYDDMAALNAAAASPQMQAVQANGALYLGAIKTFITEEVGIIG
ncbi:MAG TPA: EthD domain-containing protein [Hyphomicrobiaceae bacterium]|nr:EthD domain-containing protein [Hyphomicrobiaceae bacterium]